MSKISKQVRALSVKENTLDVENRTAEVIMATDTPVLRYSYRRGYYYEVLGFETGQVDLTRANAGAPLLDNHDSWGGSESVRGNIIPGSVRTEGNQLIGKVQFAKTADTDTLWQKVVDGNIRTFSVGYGDIVYEDVTPEAQRDKKDVIPTLKAVRWTVTELSAAPIPADPKAQLRSLGVTADNEEEIIINNQNQNRIMEDNKGGAAAAPTPEEVSEQVRKAKSEGAAEAKVRATEIDTLVRIARLPEPDKTVLEYFNSERSIAEIREEIRAKVEKLQEKSVINTPDASAKGDEKQNKYRALEEAIEINLGLKEDDGKNEYRNLSVMDMIRVDLELHGVRAVGSNDQLYELMVENHNRNMREASAKRSGEFTTSDLPALFENAMNKSLKRELEAYPRTFLKWAKAGTLPNFYPAKRIQTGAISSLPEMPNDSPEYKALSLTDGKETIQLKTYGGKFAISRRAIINDTLDGLMRVPKALIQAALQTESNLVYNILLNGATTTKLSDGGALFQTGASRKNLISSATALDLTGLAAARKLMRNQTHFDGTTYLNIEPRYLICGPANEQAAYQYTSANYTPTVQGSIAPEYNYRLVPIIDPRISNLDWYLAADPAYIDTVEYAYLEGSSGPYMEQKLGWNVDGIEMKIRHDFGTAPLEYRGLVKVVGQ